MTTERYELLWAVWQPAAWASGSCRRGPLDNVTVGRPRTFVLSAFLPSLSVSVAATVRLTTGISTESCNYDLTWSLEMTWLRWGIDHGQDH